MSKKFWAEDRETGERWKPNQSRYGVDKEFLVMYDSGYLAVIQDYGYEGYFIEPLDAKKWKTVHQKG